MRKDLYLKLKNKLDELEEVLNGGKGSGNFGHAGRPGEVGGSGKGGSNVERDKKSTGITKQTQDRFRETVAIDYANIREALDDISRLKGGSSETEGRLREIESKIREIKDTLKEIRESQVSDMQSVYDVLDLAGEVDAKVQDIKRIAGDDFNYSNWKFIVENLEGYGDGLDDFLLGDRFINGFADGFWRNGGKGSGNFGHKGRPGEVGGSAPEGSAAGESKSLLKTKKIAHGSNIDGVIGRAVLNPESSRKEVESRVPKDVLRATVADAALIDNLQSKESDYKGLAEAEKLGLQNQDYVATRIARVYEEMIYEMTDVDSRFSGKETPYKRTEEQLKEQLSPLMERYESFSKGISQTDKSSVAKKLRKRDAAIKEAYSKLQEHLTDFQKRGFDEHKETVDLTDLIENSFVPRLGQLVTNGGEGSGYFGHAGRPGKKGGSAPAQTGVPVTAGKTGADLYRAIGESNQRLEETKRHIDKIEHILGKKPQVDPELVGESSYIYFDQDGKHYSYEKRSETLREQSDDPMSRGKEVLSPEEKKAEADEDWGASWNLKGSDIKKKLKSYGLATDGLSVRRESGGYSDAWYISGSGSKLDLPVIEKIVKRKLEHYDVDERSGEILAGGNTFVFVRDTDKNMLYQKLSNKLDELALALNGGKAF